MLSHFSQQVTCMLASEDKGCYTCRICFKLYVKVANSGSPFIFLSKITLPPSTMISASIRSWQYLRVISAMNVDRHPSRPRRLNPRVKSPSDGPPQLSPIDRIISLHHGSTMAIEATPQRLQASKQYPVPSLPERIEQLQKQNSSLNYKVVYYREIEQYRKEFEFEVIRVKEKLEKALSKLARRQ